MSSRRRLSIAFGIASILAALLVSLFFALEGGAGHAPAREVTAPEIVQPEAAPPVIEKAPLPATRSPPAKASPSRKRVPSAEPLAGQTRFVRRLTAGSRLRKLKEDLRREDRDLSSASPPSWSHSAMLAADWLAFSKQEGKKSLLEILTEPPCDLETLKLPAGAAREDPLGERLLVRVWTLDGRYPGSEIEAARRNLRHVADVTGASLERGFDVLATLDMGKEVLPEAPVVYWAAGQFYSADQYCVLKTRFAPWFRAVVLRHELMHALCHRALTDYRSSRMICEGLAEYLQFCRPGDHRLAVPLPRLADNLAHFQRWIDVLSARGVRFDSLKPARLVSLPPKQFYGLRGLGYPIALAAIAYLGSEVIEEAFSRKSIRPLISAVEAIRWKEFLEFVKKNAAKGSPGRAITVEDAPPEDAAALGDLSGAEGLFRGALESLGVNLEDGASLDPESLTPPAVERFLEEGLVLEVLKEIIAAAEESRGDAGQGPILLADLSPALRERFFPARGSRVLSSLFERSLLRSTDRLGFVKDFRDALVAGGGGNGCLLAEMRALPRAVAAAGVDLQSRFTAEAVPAWLSDQNRGVLDLVIFVAGTDESAREVVRARLAGVRFTEEEVRVALAERYRQEFAEKDLPIRNALIVDLSKGQGDALPLARGIAAAQNHQGAVAYWDPQAVVARGSAGRRNESAED